ncbi:Coenzyme F420 hydrogenase/dehydrogenase, beta subunit C-terminal domain, partial [Acinetobacter baumannii]
MQSSIGSTYRQAKEDLKAGKDVLFTGTACQIAGLRNYLHRDYENLWCLDLVCHGVPSQKLLRDNVEF